MKRPHEIAAGVVDTEIAGLRSLQEQLADGASALSQSFDDAAGLVGAAGGRLIVTGMGKSGHVARKIAATFASTGTPSQFVHPAEASHGDLGMIAPDDMILALSLSGETAELHDIVAHAGRFDIKMIIVTAGSASTLAEAGDVCLLLPLAEEACSVTPAPTSSTTMMLALGDALAVAVLRGKGFTSDQFKTFHPGGRLGAALKRATDLMHHTDMPLCAPDEEIAPAIEKMTVAGFGCLGVIDGDGGLVGMVTDGDLRRHYKGIDAGRRVEDVMTRDPLTVSEDSLAGEVLSLFATRKITAVFIVDGARRPVGLVHVHDCLTVGVV